MYLFDVVEEDDVTNSKLTLLLPVVNMLILGSYSSQVFNLFGEFLWVRCVEIFW